MGVQLTIGIIAAAFYFAMGRAACPPSDRLPLRELDNAAVVGTIARGWTACGEHSRLGQLLLSHESGAGWSDSRRS